MRTTYITATVIALLILGWLFSGQLGDTEPVRHGTLAERNAAAAASAADRELTRVRAAVINASPQVQYIVLRGKTDNKRSVDVKAETSGRIVDRPVERGSRVEEGDVLCQISMEDRYAALTEARESVNQATIEYEGSIKLKERGFQSETAIAQAKAKLASAQARLERSQLEIGRTTVRAPFDGVVEDVHQEIGDYVAPGATCVTVVDLDPMLLVGRVAERDVPNLQLNLPVTGVLTDGSTVEGPITFIGQQSDPATRTYPVEIQIANPDYTLRSGLTTEIRIPVREVMAQKISPALFALNDQGEIGVRTVNEDGAVVFNLVEIIAESADGVWVTGLPDIATLITVGQELVVPGELVDIDYEAVPEMPAAAPADTGDASMPSDGPQAVRRPGNADTSA
jgi:multidrug efflux system membrane fusion protein